MQNEWINWDEYFMGVALLSGERSKDPSTKVGACIVDKRNRIVGVGYNGFPTGCHDSMLPWERQGEFLETKYPYVCHAELNAILNSISRDLQGCRLYVTLFPCHECTKALIQSGIEEVIYLQDKYQETDSTIASKKMMDMVGINYKLFESEKQQIKLKFK